MVHQIANSNILHAFEFLAQSGGWRNGLGIIAVQFMDKDCVLALTVLVSRPEIKLVPRSVAALVIDKRGVGRSSFGFRQIKSDLANESVMIANDKNGLPFIEQLSAHFPRDFCQI